MEWQPQTISLSSCIHTQHYIKLYTSMTDTRILLGAPRPDRDEYMEIKWETCSSMHLRNWPEPGASTTTNTCKVTGSDVNSEKLHCIRSTQPRSESIRFSSVNTLCV